MRVSRMYLIQQENEFEGFNWQNATGNHGNIQIHRIQWEKFHRMGFNPTGNHGKNKIHRMQFNPMVNHQSTGKTKFTGCNSIKQEITGKTQFMGCDSIHQEIAGKNPIHRMWFNSTVNHRKSRDRPNSRDVIQYNCKLQEKPNSQDVSQLNRKSQEIKGKTKFTGFDSIQL